MSEKHFHPADFRKQDYFYLALSDCNGTRTHNHLVRKRTLNHLAILVVSVNKNFCKYKGKPFSDKNKRYNNNDNNNNCPVIKITIIAPWHINIGLASSGEQSCIMGRWSSSVLADNLPRNGFSIKILVVVAPYHHYPQTE